MWWVSSPFLRQLPQRKKGGIFVIFGSLACIIQQKNLKISNRTNKNKKTRKRTNTWWQVWPFQNRRSWAPLTTALFSLVDLSSRVLNEMHCYQTQRELWNETAKEGERSQDWGEKNMIQREIEFFFFLMIFFGRNWKFWRRKWFPRMGMGRVLSCSSGWTGYGFWAKKKGLGVCSF